MAEKLNFFSGEWAERDAINRNADALESVEASVSDLRTELAHQGKEILRLRAMLMGVVEVLRTRIVVDDAELDHAVSIAWERITPRPPEDKRPTDPYRGLPADAAEPTPEEIEAAKQLLGI